MVRGIAGLMLGICVLLAFGCWIAAIWTHFKAVAHRRDGVSWTRAWRWPIGLAFGHSVYLEDLFTDAGRMWLQKSVRYFAGFFAAWAVGMAVGLVSKFASG